MSNIGLEDDSDMEYVATDNAREAWRTECREDAEAFCAHANSADIYRHRRRWEVIALLGEQSRRRDKKSTRRNGYA